jgi:hypothetical protein
VLIAGDVFGVFATLDLAKKGLLEHFTHEVVEFGNCDEYLDWIENNRMEDSQEAKDSYIRNRTIVISNFITRLKKNSKSDSEIVFEWRNTEYSLTETDFVE